MLEVYGQTENTGLATAMPLDRIKLGTVGVARPDTEVRLSPEGEILLKGPHVFMGYYGKPEKTAETIVDGWLHTGDVGTMDDEGFVRITDRMKDIIITAGGKNVTPSEIENQLKFSPYIKEVVCIGQDRPWVAALVNIDLAAVGNWAERRGIAYTSYTDLSQKPEIYDLIYQEVARVNRSLQEDDVLRGAQIRRFLILHKELDPDDEEITRTRKVRRRFVAQKYAALIEALYSDRDRIQVEAQVTYEDGRTGTVRADLRIRPVEAAASAR